MQHIFDALEVGLDNDEEFPIVFDLPQFATNYDLEPRMAFGTVRVDGQPYIVQVYRRHGDTITDSAVYYDVPEDKCPTSLDGKHLRVGNKCLGCGKVDPDYD
jgi:hypothetical protein